MRGLGAVSALGGCQTPPCPAPGRQGPTALGASGLRGLSCPPAEPPPRRRPGSRPSKVLGVPGCGTRSRPPPGPERSLRVGASGRGGHGRPGAQQVWTAGRVAARPAVMDGAGSAAKKAIYGARAQCYRFGPAE